LNQTFQMDIFLEKFYLSMESVRILRLFLKSKNLIIKEIIFYRTNKEAKVQNFYMIEEALRNLNVKFDGKMIH
jgi:hypothetical protein